MGFSRVIAAKFEFGFSEGQKLFHTKWRFAGKFCPLFRNAVAQRKKAIPTRVTGESSGQAKLPRSSFEFV